MFDRHAGVVQDDPCWDAMGLIMQMDGLPGVFSRCDPPGNGATVPFAAPRGGAEYSRDFRSLCRNEAVRMRQPELPRIHRHLAAVTVPVARRAA